MTQTSKELIKEFFKNSNSNTIPFIPWVCSFAAKLEQVSVKNMLLDSGVLSRALINTQKLIGYDVITSHFDTSLEAEALGCEIVWHDNESLPVINSHPLSEGKSISDLDATNIEQKGRIPVILDAINRIKIIKGKEVAIAGVVSGPLTISGHLTGNTFTDELNNENVEAEELVEEIGSVCLRLSRAYCELGVDILVIAEEILGKIEPERIKVLASPLQSIRNIADYYDIHTVLLGKGCSKQHIEPVFTLNMDGIVLSGDFDFQQLLEQAIEQNRRFTCTIPDSVLLGTDFQSMEPIIECLRGKHKGLFISTEWDVPYSTEVNRMQEIIKSIRT